MKFPQNSLQANRIPILFAAGLITIIWLFFSCLFLPQKIQIVNLTAQYQTERQKTQIIEMYAAAHPDIERDLGELDGKLIQVDKMLPNSNDIYDFLVQLEQAAKGSSIQLVQIKPGQILNKNGYREIPVEIFIKGNYFQMLDFLKKLEDGPRFNTITSISIKAQKDNLDAAILVVVYGYGTATVADQGAAGGRSPAAAVGSLPPNT